MKKVIKLYRLLNLLSIDVAVGAIIGSLFFAKINGVSPSYPSVLSLGFTVWIIYTADRLLDILPMKGEAASERHRFHQRNQQKLTYWIVAVTILNGCFILFLPRIIIIHGLILSLVVVIYLALRKRLHLSKELLVATLYTAGVVLPSWPDNQQNRAQYLPMLLLFLIALNNLILFSWYEKENDVNDKQVSVATLVDEPIIRYILISLFVLTFSISWYMFFQPIYHFVSLVFIAITTILFFLFKYKKSFAKNDYYRIVGDAVFLFPLTYLLLV